MSDVSLLLDAAAGGDPFAAADLLPLVYRELRRLAAARMACEPAGHTLDPTALVHEAFLRLVGTAGPDRWDSRGHFFAAAAEAMRRILVESARRRLAAKRTPPPDGDTAAAARRALHTPLDSPEAVIDLNDTLARFAEVEPQKAELVKLRFFAGLTAAEAAAALGISVATAERWWAFARAWLYAELQAEAGPAAG